MEDEKASKETMEKALGLMLGDLAKEYNENYNNPKVFEEPEVIEAEVQIDEAIRSGALARGLAAMEVYETIFRKAMRRLGPLAALLLLMLLFAGRMFAMEEKGRIDSNPFRPGEYRVFDDSEKVQYDIVPNRFRDGEYRIYDHDTGEHSGDIDDDGDIEWEDE